MNKDQLRIALENIVKVCSSSDPLERIRMQTWWALDAQKDPSHANPIMVALLEALRIEPELHIFCGKALVISGARHNLSYAALATWLIRRCFEVGSTQSLEDLEFYLQSKEFPCEQTLAFFGLNTEKPADLGHGITIFPWTALPESSEKQYVRQFRILNPFNGEPSALYRTFITTNRFQKSDNNTSAQSNGSPDIELRDALMCIGLAVPADPQKIASWTSFPKWVPISSPSEQYRRIEPTSGRAFPQSTITEIRRLFASFHSRTDNTKARLRLAMERLNQMRHKGVVDAAIDLGIALETLYLNDLADDRGELTFRLRIRSARFLGCDSTDRRRIFDLVGELYKRRSIAVHTGKAPPKLSARVIRELLDEGFELGAETVKRFIVDGEPDWNAVQLG
jgi:hypothetical protein